MSETGRILIEKLDIYAYHGFFSEEERLGQRFVLDLVLDADLRAAAASDHLADTVDYGRAVAIIAEAFTARRYHLLEGAARAVALAIFDAFPLSRASRSRCASPRRRSRRRSARSASS